MSSSVTSGRAFFIYYSQVSGFFSTAFGLTGAGAACLAGAAGFGFESLAKAFSYWAAVTVIFSILIAGLASTGF